MTELEQKNYVVFYYPKKETYFYHRGAFLKIKEEFDYSLKYELKTDMLVGPNEMVKPVSKKEIEIEEWDPYKALTIAGPNAVAFEFIVKINNKITKQSHIYYISPIDPEDLLEEE